MATRHLEQMGLDVQQVQVTTDFLEAYANTTIRELKAYEAPDRPAPERFPSPEDLRWVLRADAASALREAAQWAMFFDRARARRLLVTSASYFLEDDHAFGTFLMTAMGERPSLGTFRQGIDRLAVLHGARPPFGDPGAIPPALQHPQQQAYLLLACGGTARVAEEYGETLRELAGRSPNRVGVAPVGALGTPIRRFWDIAMRLLEGNAQSGPRAVASHLAAMSERYAESIELARVNDYLWNHAAAPVDAGDIDIAGIVALTVSRFGADRVGAVLRDVDEQLSPLARTPIEVAMEFAVGTE
jgi:hypothetical protein